ncbi:hypothetical protein EJB05_55610, partial [Eragrostis curvula]
MDSVKKDITRGVKFALVVIWMTIPFWVIYLRNLPPKFSVEFRGATGLDAAPAHNDAPISAAFNFTLHAANRRQGDRCYRHGEAVVRYSGYTVASARTRAFCVGTKEARDVPVVAWAEGVGLPWSIRERMAADWRAGAVDLEVEVKLLRGDDGSARPTWVSCKVKAGGGSGAKPSRTTRCTAFGFQNWASDITPAWMQLHSIQYRDCKL